ncbi:hypothetical protein [Pararhizobium sp. DWP1-1-3]|uniref:hypothetical protein n=1 Tax=Pararhizobium sp. DWP1-1-3 TaxID=2804652 RepID=UPI003CE6EFF9
MNFVQIGKKRLRLKMPHLRSKICSGDLAKLEDLFEAYGLAVLALDGFRLSPVLDLDLIQEYERTCAEIEKDVDTAALGGKERCVNFRMETWSRW